MGAENASERQSNPDTKGIRPKSCIESTKADTRTFLDETLAHLFSFLHLRGCCLPI